MRAALALQQPDGASPTLAIHTALSVVPREGSVVFSSALETIAPVCRAIATVLSFSFSLVKYLLA